jgi:hypothetical protein
MSKPCTVCQHPEHIRVNIDLATGTSVRRIEANYQGLAKSSLDRHRKTCLTGIITTALLALEKPGKDRGIGRENEPGSTEGKAEEMCSHARREILDALQAKDRKTAAILMREHRSYMEVLGKVRGELSPEASAAQHRPMFLLPAGAMVSVTVNQLQPVAARAELAETIEAEQPAVIDITPEN